MTSFLQRNQPDQDSPLDSNFDENGPLSPMPGSMPVFLPPLTDNRFSSTSSAYSPIEGSFPMNKASVVENPSTAPSGKGKRFSEGSQNSISDTIKSIDTFNTSVSNQASIHELSHIQEESNGTLNTFLTAKDPSFSSINESLFRNVDHLHTPVTSTILDDTTPKLSTNAMFNHDSTPKISEDEVFTSQHSSISVISDKEPMEGNNLPQQKLSNKFKRLSITIQQSTASKSRDSFQFLNTFQQNVNKSNGNLSSVPNDQRTNDADISRDSNTFDFNSSPQVYKEDETLLIDQEQSDMESEYGAENGDVYEQEKPLFFDKPLPQRSRPDLSDIQEQDSTMISSTKDLSLNETKAVKTRENRVSTESQNENDEHEYEDLSSLFIHALHPFDATTLESTTDASICLSFKKNDLAFIHTIDESGWGEVTLIDSLSRGWVPMNYFTIAVHENEKDRESINSEDEDTIPNNQYLKPLFDACGKFLLNPLSYKTKRGKYSFSTKVVNAIRDGVRHLLQETDCLSRSNEIVTKRPIVRKIRKGLLADWYRLMVKANEYKGTSNFNKIEILTLMVYEVIRKSVGFLNIWSLESKLVIKRRNEKSLQNDIGNYPLLSTPPFAKQRVTEINGLLYTYLGLIIGRLDLIEHNPVGCEILENLTHQIILLLRELLFISKTGSNFSKSKSSSLDHSLDGLLSLVSELVSCVKSLVAKTLNENDQGTKQTIKENNATYYYTMEGGNLIQVTSKMVRSVSKTIASIRKLLETTGDFKLNSERSYPDYKKIRLDPEMFIKKCSMGLVKSQSIRRRDIRDINANSNNAMAKRSMRYSVIRAGQTGDLSLTQGGANMLNHVLLPYEESTPFSLSHPEFEPFTTESNGSTNNSSTAPSDGELLYDTTGNLLGASFKGLVYTLTNEVSPPEYFFVSTFFLCFRNFGNGVDFLEELITRFDITNSEISDSSNLDLSLEVRIKSRRRLIAKMLQIWMESYWNHKFDSPLLSTLINFFNEGISIYLPFDAMKLIEIVARLSTKPLIENSVETQPLDKTVQLVKRNITTSNSMNFKRSSSTYSKTNGLNERYSMVDGYELSKINTNSSNTGSLKSMTLPMPLGIGNQTSSSNSLLTRAQVTTIEKIILTYRAILGSSWCNEKMINVKNFIPMELEAMLKSWFFVCSQTWTLSNYRPNLLDFNGLEIAKQLTLIESAIFCAIKPDELLNENFTAKRAHLNFAPNINRSFLFTNCLSEYVLESVLQPDVTIKQRVNTVKNWLKIAISCLYLRNFNTLAAIMTSLQSFLITRLTKVWEELSTKYTELYEYLSSIIHPEKNYTIYRSKLRNFLVSNEFKIPIVPYLSLFLQDLTFIAEGNQNYRKATSFLSQKIINIDKYLKMSRIIADIETLQVSYIEADIDSHPAKRNSILSLSGSKPSEEKFSIIPVAPLQELILLETWKVKQLNIKEDDRAWKLSCIVQPRDES